MTYNLIIKTDCIRLYDVYDNREIYIHREQDIKYDINRIDETAKKIIDGLIDYDGLDSIEEINIQILLGTNEVVNEVVKNALGMCVKSTFNLETILKRVLDEMIDVPELMIERYGINYDGVNYCYQDDVLKSGDYSLLGLNIEDSELLNHLV